MEKKKRVRSGAPSQNLVVLDVLGNRIRSPQNIMTWH